MNAAVELQAVHKRYGAVHALRGIDLEVHQGEVFGFIGPNGAGKTTTMRILLDLLRPSEGSACGYWAKTRKRMVRRCVPASDTYQGSCE